MKRKGIIFIAVFLIAFSLLAGCNDTTASESKGHEKKAAKVDKNPPPETRDFYCCNWRYANS
ncbi:hypothetical protein [Virgibacillus dokdonensis]|uniref:Lipoprotein n=1 Tax=Virgibacillus dokdonensis TaxID=302167 RepID=A0A2K9J079_9BACI|nr:hypothetical protein [Virgibacillus dokdonensis]AUJ25085.1 hypothetical protein A21D_02004 [Virgibacillus dokdonensis]